MGYSLLNSRACATNVKNTGLPGCPIDYGNIEGAIMVPTTFKLTKDDLLSVSAIVTKLQTATYDVKSRRIYPFHDFLEINDGTAAPAKITYGYGGIATGRESNIDWSFLYKKSGINGLAAARSFRGAGYNYLFYDHTGLLIGTSLDGESIVGIPYSYFSAYLLKISTGAALSDYRIDFGFLPTYIVDSPGNVEVGLSSLLSIAGLRDVNMNVVSRNAGIIAVSLTTVSGNMNLGDSYSAQLAAIGNFKATDAVTGLAIAITSVAYLDPNFVITLNTADPNYVAGNKITITAINAAGLNTALVVGYEILAPITTPA